MRSGVFWALCLVYSVCDIICGDLRLPSKYLNIPTKMSRNISNDPYENVPPSNQPVVSIEVTARLQQRNIKTICDPWLIYYWFKHVWYYGKTCDFPFHSNLWCFCSLIDKQIWTFSWGYNLPLLDICAGTGRKIGWQYHNPRKNVLCSTVWGSLHQLIFYISVLYASTIYDIFLRNDDVKSNLWTICNKNLPFEDIFCKSWYLRNY